MNVSRLIISANMKKLSISIYKECIMQLLHITILTHICKKCLTKIVPKSFTIKQKETLQQIFVYTDTLNSIDKNIDV